MARQTIYLILMTIGGALLLPAAVNGHAYAPDYAAQDREVETVTWIELNEMFHSIGTPEQRNLHDTHWAIIYNPVALRSVVLTVWDDSSQSWITMDINPGLSRRSLFERMEVAREWLVGQPGGVELVEKLELEREIFKQVHPDYVNYSIYLAALSEHPGGTSHFRDYQAQLDQGFENALVEETAWLQARGLTEGTLEAALNTWTATGEAFLIGIDGAHQ